MGPQTVTRDEKALYALYAAVDAGLVGHIEKVLNDWDFTGKDIEDSLVFWHGDYRVLMPLLAHGLAPDALTPQGERLLISFCRKAPIPDESVRKLLEAGADVSLPDPFGTQPLIWICGKADSEQQAMDDRPYFYSDVKLALLDSLIQAMLEAGADPNAADARRLHASSLCRPTPLSRNSGAAFRG